MSTYNIQLHENKKISLKVCFLRLLEEKINTQKRVRISHEKRAIGV